MDESQHRALAGASLLAAATLTVLGFTTAEAMYPGYSTTTQTISALGAEGGTAGSRAVFNPMMVAAGVLTLVGTYGLHRAYENLLLSGVFATTATVGFVGVGLFPAETGTPHFVAAVVAFGGMGVAALVVAALVEAPFRYVSATLGAAEFVAFLAFFTLGGSTPLGVGGLERWVAYLGLVWAACFGGYLLSGTGSSG